MTLGLGIVFLSHTATSSPFRVGSHHLSRELAAQGHRVVHVSNPVSLAHVVQCRDPEIRSRARLARVAHGRRVDGVHHLVPRSVVPLGLTARSPGYLGVRRALRGTLRAAGMERPDLVFVDQPMLHPLLALLDPRRVVYRPTDIVTDPHPRAAQDVVVARADAVVATSLTVLDDVAARGAVRYGAVVENGVDYARFADGRAWERRAGAVYIGALDARFDWDAVSRFAAAGVPIDVHGPGGAPHALPPEVVLHGPVRYDDVPALLARHRVGLLPLTPIPVNTGRSPMKLYEYLAAGLNVVSLRTPALRGEEVPGLFDYPEVSQAAAALGAALAEPPPDSARELARAMDWSQRARLLLEHALAA